MGSGPARETDTVLTGAETIDLPGGPVGALLCHGFTGTTQAIRPWAEHLSAADLTVLAPRLPGHGTRWQDLNRTRWSDWYATVSRSLTELRERCATTFVMGLSMGGTLALRLAELRAAEVTGVVVVNASLLTRRREARLLPLAQHLVPSLPGISSDIKQAGVTELGYDRTPLKAMHSLAQAWPLVRRDLSLVTAPVLAFRSTVDHVVEPASGDALVNGLRAAGREVELRELTDSFHVATLDRDAHEIFSSSLAFVRAHSATSPRGLPA